MNKITWLDKISSLAKENIILFIFIYLVFLGILDSSFKMLLGTDLNIFLSYFYLNILAFSILYFFMLAIVHSLSDNRSISESVISLSLIFWLIAISPLITCLIGGNISYLNLMGSSSMMELLLFNNDINNGLLVIYLLISLNGILIVKKSNKSNLGNSISGLSGMFFSFIGFIGIFSQYNITGIKSTDFSSIVYDKHLGLLLLILLIQLSVIILMIMFVWKKRLLKHFIFNLKIFRTLHFISMTFIGFVVLSQVNNHTVDITNLWNLIFIFLPALCMIFTWQFTAMVNDIYDIDIDRVVHPDRPLVAGKIEPTTYKNIAVAFAVTSTLISLYLGIFMFLLNSTFVLAAVLYSRPPIRLKERVYGYVCVGYASVVAFFFGMYSYIYWSISIEISRWFLFRGVPFYDELASISLIIFVALSVSPYINALSDYEGDKESGVNNIYTIYGREKGKKIVTILIVFLFLSPLFLFPNLFDLIVFIPLSLISAYIYYIYEDHRPIFVLYFIIVLYSVMRYTGFF